jgi:hypothetical protein
VVIKAYFIALLISLLSVMACQGQSKIKKMLIRDNATNIKNAILWETKMI